jgi:hypothetical protein
MASAIVDGIATRYEVIGSGPPLLMHVPCGFNATSAARYLEECLPRAEYWDMAVAQQTEAPTNARILEFLAKVGD